MALAMLYEVILEKEGHVAAELSRMKKEQPRRLKCMRGAHVKGCSHKSRIHVDVDATKCGVM
jgi:hypothetical protein